MEYTSLGRTALHVSKISYGTWQFSGEWGQIKQEQWNAGKATIRQALELGINLFDTAQAYGFGLAERLLGEALQPELKSQRDKIVLATKGGLRMEGDRIVRDSSVGWLRQGVEESLRALGVSSIDLYQVHWPDPNTPMEETASALDELVREGKIRYVGVSNFNVEQMQAFERTRKIDTLQPPYNLFRREIEEEILPYCEAADIGVLVYGALAHGLLGGSFSLKTTFPPDDWRSQHESFSGEGFRRNVAVVERLKRVAQEQGMTIAQLAVAWVLAQPAVDVAIVGARMPEQLAQTAAASEGHLTPETLQEIESIMRGAVPIGSSAPE
ncbi:general stress protein 69 [Reticulibacter mediterranei]|uniref:General stress protein 69 n=1 Tax=Reticulibacter mediterranei TaxID=2778369 RepID=A0A8J3N0Y1_9CHLR|nr:aldo/keto reductase [Reticulibacter mediterranei]GHO91705.1 general stress protein 69 [Reticulibacter mediterranei]